MFFCFFAEIGIGTLFSSTISNGIIEYYSFPFPADGITLSLSVSSGYINCYASDRFRNPNQNAYDWVVSVRDYMEVYLVPRVSTRRVLYVSFLGIDMLNVFQAQSSPGNTLTVGKLFS